MREVLVLKRLSVPSLMWTTSIANRMSYILPVLNPDRVSFITCKLIACTGARKCYMLLAGALRRDGNPSMSTWRCYIWCSSAISYPAGAYLILRRTRHWRLNRGSVPVAISLGIYQSTAVSEVYTSLGFLVAIIAVVTVNLLPRAELIQMTLTICTFTAIAIPVTMLATWSGLQARFHTDPDGLHAYNSSQSGK